MHAGSGGCMDAVMVTRDDIIRAGACVDGVYAWCEQIGITATAMPVSDLLTKSDARGKEWIEKACGLNGYGCEYGYGDGDGHGHGHGEGTGYGCEYGYGDGDGHGHGDGKADGHGDGHGEGTGYGYGYGYGDS